MRPFILILMLSLFALPAHADELTETYAQWQKLRDPDATSGIRFVDGRAFLDENPGWPDEKIIRLRTEAAALFEHPSHEAMHKFCTDYPPISGRGMIACATAQAGDDDATRAAWLKRGWLQGDFNEDEEDRILKSIGGSFTRAEHIARTERLLYEGKTSAAKRMLPRLPAEQQSLAKVRIAMIADNKNAPRMLNMLTLAQRNSPGILYERLRWRMRHNDDDIAMLLLSAPKNTPYPDQWWPIRAFAAREAMAKHNYTQALAMIANYGDIKGEALAEALWLNGWITLQHHGKAGDAYKHFFKLYTSVTTPVSKARAAYWAARAAEKNGNADIAQEWLEKAARHPTVFYGQLAISRLKPGAPLTLPEPYVPTAAEKATFESDPLVIITRVLAKKNDDAMRDLFLAALAAHAETKAQFALVAALATQVAGVNGGVDVAKLALRDAIVMIPSGWPRIALPSGLSLEPALTLSITRQESEFKPDARSLANAQGLMQLLPATAKQVAKRMDMAYSGNMLIDPATNLKLGSHYLGQIINGFDGSYILGIASYNAGPGSVRRWLRTMGSPPKNLDGALDWLEAIPFSETRNYVMRVLENVSVYRALATPEAPLAIEKDLVR